MFGNLYKSKCHEIYRISLYIVELVKMIFKIRKQLILVEYNIRKNRFLLEYTCNNKIEWNLCFEKIYIGLIL